MKKIPSPFNVNAFREVLKLYVDDFLDESEDFYKDPRNAYSLGNAEFLIQFPDSSGTNVGTGATIDFTYTAMAIGNWMREKDSSKALFEFMFKHNLIPETHRRDELVGYDAAISIIPSCISKVAGGFIARNFELNGNKASVTEASFEKAFGELISFYEKDSVDMEFYMLLGGVSGDSGIAINNGEIEIRKIDNGLSMLLNLKLNQDRLAPFDKVSVRPGEYVLKFKAKINKVHFHMYPLETRYDNLLKQIINKWETWVTLGLVGNVTFGSILSTSTDWVMAPHGPYRWSSHKSFGSDYKAKFEDSFKSLGGIVLMAIETDFAKIEDKIGHAISRLKKAKNCSTHSDKVIELAIALEFIIPNSQEKKDIGLNLKLRTIKILDLPDDEREQCYAILGKFYSLRSNIMHGNKIVTNDPKHVDTISKTEILIQRVIVQMIILLKKYKYGKIEKCLETAIFKQAPLSLLLSK